MSLTAYTITALERDVADATASGKQVIVGASCSMYSQPSDTVVTLYDDSAGSNGSTAKTTGANGQVVVYIEPGEYRLSVNGIDSFITIGGSAKITTVDLIALDSASNVGDVIDTNSYSVAGDGGGGQWVSVAATGAASQSPSQLGDALLNDANGNQWALIPTYGALSIEVSASALGAIADGATNSYGSLAAGVAYLKSNRGGRLILPAGVVVTASELLIDSSNITVSGAGSDISHDVGSSQGLLAGTELKWAGSAGGTILRFTSPEGATLPKQSGCGVSGIFFRGVNAAKGLVVESQDKGLFEQLHFNEFSDACIELNTVATLGDAADPQKNKFSQITCRQEVNSGDFIRLDGLTSTANTSNNTFYQLSATINNGDAYKLNNCDNNTFIRCGAFRIGGGSERKSVV